MALVLRSNAQACWVCGWWERRRIYERKVWLGFWIHDHLCTRLVCYFCYLYTNLLMKLAYRLCMLKYPRIAHAEHPKPIFSTISRIHCLRYILKKNISCCIVNYIFFLNTALTKNITYLLYKKNNSTIYYYISTKVSLWNCFCASHFHYVAAKSCCACQAQWDTYSEYISSGELWVARRAHLPTWSAKQMIRHQSNTVT